MSNRMPALFIDSRRKLPPWKRETFARWGAKHKRSPGKGVTLFNDTFTNHYEPEIGSAAVEVLERAGCAVTVCEHLDETWSIRYGPHIVGRYTAQGYPWLCERKLDRREKAVEKPLRGKPGAGFPLRLGIPQKARDSHFPTATKAAVHRP